MAVSDVESDLTRRTITEEEHEGTPLLYDRQSIVGKEDVNTASFVSGVFNLSNTVVGAGIMSLPYAIKILGVIPGVFLIVVSGFLTLYSVNIMLRFGKNGRINTYGQLVDSAFGRTGEILLQATIAFGGICGSIVYLIIIADVVSGSTSGGLHHSGVLEEWFGEQWYTSRAFVLISMTTLVLIPTTWRKRIDSLRHTSAIAVGSAVFFIVIVIGMTTYKLADGKIEQPDLFPSIDNLSSFWYLFTAIPVLVGAYTCHFNVHSIQNELRDPSQMKSVVKCSLVVCGVIYIMIGLFGYLLFGDSTASDVLSNFDADLGVPYSSVLTTLVRLSYAVHILFVLPVNFFATRTNFDGLVFSSTTPLASDEGRFALTTLSLFFVILIGAILIPNIWVAVQFMPVGSLISFIFPASVALRDYPRIATKRDKILSWGLIIIAVFSISISMYSNVVSLI